VRHEIRYGVLDAISNATEFLSKRRKRQLFEAWLRSLRANPPQVLLGANININDGIRQHLLGIDKYSSLNVSLAPPDQLLATVTYHDLLNDLSSAFFDYNPQGIEVLHSHVYPYFVRWCNAKKHIAHRWVHTYHSPYYLLPSATELLPWQMEINDVSINVGRNADVRISVSRWQQEYLKQSYGIDTVYLPNGVDVEACDRADGASFSKKYNTERFILFVGRNDAVKNPADFVRLAARLPQQRFVVIGRGLSVESLRRDWDLDPTPNVMFVGVLPRAQVQDAIAACDLLVMTSLWEGLPTVALEAMSHSKPLVVSDNPGCVEAVGAGEYGVIYEQSNLADLVEKVSRTLVAPRPAHSRQRVLTEYDWRMVARQLDTIYYGDYST
jgi:glycosyltransferase involved in cell wall biosynthesis